MSRNGREPLRTAVEVLDETWASLERAARQARGELVETGDASEDVQIWLENEVLNMWYQLEGYAPKVEGIWHQYRLNEVPQVCARGVGTTDPTTGHFGMATGGGETVIEHAPVDRLLLYYRGFRRCLTELELGINVQSASGGARLKTVDIQNARFGMLGEFAETEFAQALIEDIEGQREGGAIVVIDAEDARTGVGKTSAAVAFAKFASGLFGYDLQTDDLVLSGRKLEERYAQQPGEQQVSVAVWDEAVGAGSGDARRAMAQGNVDLGRAWQVMRQQRVITFVTLADWGDLDPRLQKLSDYRLWCRRDIGQAQAYEVGTEFGSGGIRTRGLGPGDGAEPIAFPDMKESEDPHYMALKEKKDELIDSGTLDADSMHEEAAEETDSADGPDLFEIADTVADNIEEYTSIHGGNGRKYLDSDLIEMKHDLSLRNAKKVKSLVEKEGVEI